ncbi:MAG TPA: hypothetical protein DHW22_09260 [Planctomycetaceae bacterium]|jgi:hypothetical protein|nr:hypothetical protein [Planctomycetaceae bacterium]
MLEREELIEQAYLYKMLSERLPQGIPLQEVLEQVREESLATTKLPLAIDYMLSELRHYGIMAPAMANLSHYFTPFQTYLIEAAEQEGGRFDIRTAVEVLRCEVEYRSAEPSPAGLFLFQFESLCRNRLSYDHGLKAISRDAFFDPAWQDWILIVRRQIGIVDFADMVYVRSQHYYHRRFGEDSLEEPEQPILFATKEGKIAWANRKKDPLFLFAALQRQLGYPEVPRPKAFDDTPQITARLVRRMEQLEGRIQLLEEEQRGGIDLSNFFQGEMPFSDSSEPPSS